MSTNENKYHGAHRGRRTKGARRKETISMTQKAFWFTIGMLCGIAGTMFWAGIWMGAVK